jgi:flagellar hook-associated protein 3 FlgL
VRVTQTMPETQLLANLDNLMTSILASQQELATGTSIQQPSDNPVGTAQYLTIQRAQAWNGQWSASAQAASGFMGAADQAMTQLTQILQSAHAIAVAAGSGSVNQADLSAQASQVAELVQQAESLANTQYGDQYVFAGTTGQAPWNQAAGQWNLTAPPPGQVTFEISSGVVVAGSVDGYTLFQGSVNGTGGPGILSPNGASPAAGNVGVLQQLQSDLASGNTSNLGNDIQLLEDAIAHVSAMQADLGARMQRAQSVSAMLGQLGVELGKQAAQVDSTNMPQMVAQLTNQQAVYQAALDIGAKMLMPTLASLIG